MNHLNDLIITGVVGQRPRIKTFRTAADLCVFHIYQNRNVLDFVGREVNKTDWFMVTVWGREANRYAQTIAPGQTVLIKGRIAAREWTSGLVCTNSTEISTHSVQIVDEPGRAAPPHTPCPEIAWRAIRDESVGKEES